MVSQCCSLLQKLISLWFSVFRCDFRSSFGWQTLRSSCCLTSKDSQWVRDCANCEPHLLTLQLRWKSGTVRHLMASAVKQFALVYLFCCFCILFLVPSFIRRLTFSNVPKRNISFYNRLNASISRVSPNSLVLNIFWFVHVRHLCMSPPDLGSLPPQLPSGPQRSPAVEFTHEKTERTFWNRSSLLLPVSPDFASL